MLENITRYIEQGEKPLAAAFKGASEIGFTIVSISISLVAVLIPLLLMGGIIGRLFREFAVTLSMAIFVSLVVSLTLTPMMASRFLRAHSEVKHGRFYQWSERAFDAMLHRYERGLDLALRWSKTTLVHLFRDGGAVGLPLHHHPQGLFPATGQRLSYRDLGSGAGHFLCRHEAASGGAQRYRAGRSRRRQHRHVHRRRRQRAQYRPPVHHAETARSERDANAGQIIARLRPKLDKVEGARLYHAGFAGRAARRPRHAYPVRIHVAGCQSGRAQRMGAEDPGQDADAAGTARRRDRSADPGHDADADDRPRHRIALRHRSRN